MVSDFALNLNAFLKYQSAIMEIVNGTFVLMDNNGYL